MDCIALETFSDRVCLQLLRGVTISAGGVLPNIHPELLSKKRGSKGKLEAVITPPPAERKAKTAKKAVVKKLATQKSTRVKVRTDTGHFFTLD